jgi:hypothetical protein
MVVNRPADPQTGIESVGLGRDASSSCMISPDYSRLRHVVSDRWTPAFRLLPDLLTISNFTHSF